MPIEVEAPDGTIIEFPDNMPHAQIERVMAKQYPAPKAVPAKPKPAPRPALQAAQNIGAGLVQGAAQIADLPWDLASGVQSGLNSLIGHGASAVAGAFGASQKTQNALSEATQRGEHDIQAQMSPLSKAVERISPTPDDPQSRSTRTMANLVGGLFLPLPAARGKPAAFPAAATAGKAAPRLAAREAAQAAGRAVVDAGKNAGVRVLRTDVVPPRTFVGKTVQATGERIPYAGTGGARQAQQAERVAAVKQLIEDFGGAVDHPAIDDVAADLVKVRGKALERLSAAKNSVIDKVPGLVPVTNAVKAIGEKIAELQGIGNPELAPVISRLEGYQQALQGKTLRQIEENRKIIGDAFKAPELAGVRTTGEKALSAIYGPLRTDMGNFIAAKGEQGDFAKWKGANDQLSTMAGELKVSTFKKVLSDAESTPEAVGQLLFSAKPSDVRRVTAGLSAQGRARAQAAVLQRAVEKSGGFDAISPDRFANELGRLGKTTGVVFEGADLARVEGLKRLLDATKRAGVASAAPPTGVQNSIPILAAVLTDVMGGAGSAITTGTVAGLLARVYESAPVRDAALKVGRTKPGSAQEGAMLERAAVVLASELRNMTWLNDNVGVAAAARDTEKNQQDQQGSANP